MAVTPVFAVNCEIEFLPAGEASKAGDAIAVRYGNDYAYDPRQSQDAATRFTAFVSATKDDENHPRRIFLNSFTRRGRNAHATRGGRIVCHCGFAVRSGYSDIYPIAFAGQVEGYDS